MQRTTVLASQFAASRGPLLQELEPRAQNGCLYFIQATVDACLGVDVAVRLASVAKSLDAARHRRIVCDRGTAIAECAKVFRGVEAERAADAERSDWCSAP